MGLVDVRRMIWGTVMSGAVLSAIGAGAGLAHGQVLEPAPVARADREGSAAQAWTASFHMQHAAHVDGTKGGRGPRSKDARSAPDVVVHGPEGLDFEGPLHVVVFLHGFTGCAAVLMHEGEVPCTAGAPPRSGWGLAGEHDRAGTQSLFVIPQLAYLKRSGDAGCFARKGCFRAFLDELLNTLGREGAALHTGRPRGIADVASVTLVAHSAGYQTALGILTHGDVDRLVRDVVLLDALYAGAGRFAAWLAASERDPRARIVSLYHGHGKTRTQSRYLYARLRRRLGEQAVVTTPPERLQTALGTETSSESRRWRYLMSAVPTAHGKIPERHLAVILAGLGLPRRHDAQHHDVRHHDTQRRDRRRQDAQRQDAQRQDAQRQDAQRRDAQRQDSER